MPTAKHDCPIPGCTRQVSADKLMCARHFATLPTNVQTRLYAAWDGGRGKGTREHALAMGDAILYACQIARAKGGER